MVKALLALDCAISVTANISLGDRNTFTQPTYGMCFGWSEFGCPVLSLTSYSKPHRDEHLCILHLLAHPQASLDYSSECGIAKEFACFCLLLLVAKSPTSDNLLSSA